MAETTTWLTQEAYDRLNAELEHLKGPGRTEIAQKIDEARAEGDLKENGGYHAAREEQAKQEARIRELKAKLENAQIGTPPDDGVVEPGMVVTVEMFGDKETFLLGSREVLGTDSSVDYSVYSPQSPLGAAVLGAKVGDEVRYAAPSGKEITVVVLKVGNL